MSNLDLFLIVGFIGPATLIYLMERQLNRSNALLKAILDQTNRSNERLGDILKSVEANLDGIANRPNPVLLAIEGELKGSLKGTLLEMSDILREASSSNGAQLRLIHEEMRELISEMAAILLIVRPD
ncbi:MAG: hypothetical protein ACLPSF_11405 [Methylocella sp.]